jgi:hypothetical protein
MRNTVFKLGTGFTILDIDFPMHFLYNGISRKEDPRTLYRIPGEKSTVNLPKIGVKIIWEVHHGRKEDVDGQNSGGA